MKWFQALVMAALLIALFHLSAMAAFAQCAMCKVAAESSSELAGKMNAGILYLLSVPYVIIGTFAALFYRAYRNRNNGREQPPWH
ncbi:MAG: hypothetical protein NZT92_23545 [Abditibacteriales bacterium]|nr:hypothetical protein [Abditibacteriales bacterium]MDW8368532.1 hypothetical protein [Abditibacteriales bacterium]